MTTTPDTTTTSKKTGDIFVTAWRRLSLTSLGRQTRVRVRISDTVITPVSTVSLGVWSSVDQEGGVGSLRRSHSYDPTHHPISRVRDTNSGSYFQGGGHPPLKRETNISIRVSKTTTIPTPVKDVEVRLLRVGHLSYTKRKETGHTKENIVTW